MVSIFYNNKLFNLPSSTGVDFFPLLSHKYKPFENPLRRDPQKGTHAERLAIWPLAQAVPAARSCGSA